VQRVHELAAEAVARYEQHFAETVSSATPSGSTAAIELFDRLAPSLEQVLEEEHFQEALTLQEKKHWSEWTGDQINLLAIFLDEHLALLDDIRALGDLREPVYRADLSKGMGTDLPHLAPLRTMARLLRFEASIRAHSGDLEGAIEDYHAILELGETLCDEPFTISQLVRVALNAIAFEGMGSEFPLGELSVEQACVFVQKTEGMCHREGFESALANEAMLAINSASRQPFASIANEEAVPVIPETNTLTLLFLYPSPLGDDIVRADRQTCAKFMEHIIRVARKPYFEAQDELDTIEVELASLSFLKGYTKALVPQLVRIQAVQPRNEAMLDLMRIGVLLEAQYAETGSYPASLDAVADDLGGSLPVDPFTGAAYVYIPEGDVFMLYSLGANQQDDGGRHHYLEGDIVWRGIKEKGEGGIEGPTE